MGDFIARTTSWLLRSCRRLLIFCAVDTCGWLTKNEKRGDNLNRLIETRGRAATFAGRVVHVSEQNPSFLLLKSVRQNGRDIESGDGIWFRSPVFLRRVKVSEGDSIVFKGQVAIGHDQNESAEDMIIESCDLEVVDSVRNRPSFYVDEEGNKHMKISTKEKVLRGLVYDEQVPKIPFDENRRSRCSDITEFIESAPLIVFTGRIQGMSRRKAEEAAEELGCVVDDEIFFWNHTDIFVVIGEEGDPRWKFGNYGWKVANAMELKEDGTDIKFVAGQEFRKQVMKART